MLNPLELTDKNILVTGATSGIGEAIAIYLSKLGANIILTGRNREKLEQTFVMLEPGDHAFYVLDLNDLDGIKEMINDICSDGLRLNGLVHSAGVSITVPVSFLKLNDLKSIMNVNFFSFIELVKNFSRRDVNGNGGSIVAISSISSKVGARGLSAYGASKGALDSSIKSLALDLAPKNIRVNSVAPGMIATRIYEGLKEIVNNKDMETELKKRQVLGIGDPEDVAKAAAFLLSDASRFITGTAMVVDGGYLAH